MFLMPIANGLLNVGFFRNAMSDLTNLVCAVLLILCTVIAVRKGRLEIMIIPMGIYLLSCFLWMGSNLLYFGYVALVAAVTAVFFICVRRGSNMRLVAICSIVCAVIWFLVVIFGTPIYVSRMIGISASEVYANWHLFIFSAIKDLLFFCGIALFGIKPTGTAR
jgi:hypothetical protein